MVVKQSRRTGRALVFIIPMLALAAAVFGSLYYRGGPDAGSRSKFLTATVERGPFDHVVTEQGELESSKNIEVKCEVRSLDNGPSSTILWVIDEGTWVEKGDKVLELDVAQLETQMKQQRIRVANAESTEIRARANVKTAEISLRQYLEGTYLSERKTILSQIALAEQALRTAELKLASARKLVDKGMITALQIENDEFAVSKAKQDLELEKSRLVVLDTLIKEKNKVQLESNIESMKAQLESDRSVLAQEQDTLRELEEQINKASITSPARGVVVYNNTSDRGRGVSFVVEPGAQVRERQTILKLPDPTQMQVKALVNESRILQLSSGMSAMVRVEGVPQEIAGRVKQVNRYAQPGSFFTSAIKEYGVIVEIDNPPNTIRSGMTAEVMIFVEHFPDALLMPVQCVYEYKGHLFCARKSSQGWETIEVEIGATNDELVSITKGLDEGDEVLLTPYQNLGLLDLPDLDEIDDPPGLSNLGSSTSSENSATSTTATTSNREEGK